MNNTTFIPGKERVLGEIPESESLFELPWEMLPQVMECQGGVAISLAVSIESKSPAHIPQRREIPGVIPPRTC